MNSSIHTLFVAQHIQAPIDEAAAARLAREARPPRERRSVRWIRTPSRRLAVLRRRTV